MDQGVTPAADTQTSLLDEFAGNSDYATIDDAPDECDPNRGSTFGVCGRTFPFLGDAGQIFGVLMGKDATLVRYDAGTFGAGAGFGFCFPPILIGPVPVQICIGGSFRVEGRFAIGYDTSGLRRSSPAEPVRTSSTGSSSMTTTLLQPGAGGQVHRHRFRRGRRQRLHLQGRHPRRDHLHDPARPPRRRPQDGKLRIEEIVSRLANPLCLFDMSGKMEAALSAFVEIDLFLTSVGFSIEIVRITLLEFDFYVCSPEPPNLADARDGPGRVQRMSSPEHREFASRRNVAAEEIDEIFTVRQMESYTSGPNNGKTRFSITAYGIQEDEFLTTTAGDNGYGEARCRTPRDGDDVICAAAWRQLRHAVAAEPAEPAGAVQAQGRDPRAGTENDELTTGDGNDDVAGNDGNDRLITGVGVDKIRGGDHDDKIDAGDGNDTDVQGGNGNDNINGGKGGDTLRGNGDNDVVSAGPDNPTATSVDTLRGDGGNDTLTADGGNDKLYGDEVLDFDCLTGRRPPTTSGNGGDDNNSDVLIGADGDDEMYGGVDKDQLDGGNGDDTLCGGGGRDEIVAGAGQDDAEGGGGDDNIAGGTDNSPAASGGDVLNGGAGRDYIIGDEGTLNRNQSTNVGPWSHPTGDSVGNDSINGGTGDDFMWGQAGTDTMNGNENDDEMRGGLGVDTMNGDANDEICTATMATTS